MKIGYATSDWAIRALDESGRPTYGGAGWYRCGLPARHLRDDLGFDVVEGSLAWSRDLKVFGVREWPTGGDEVVIHWDVDLVVLQRWMFASVAVESPSARASGQVIVQDVDDNFWALDPKNRAFASTDPKKSKIENREHYLRSMETASAITVSTPHLADSIRRLGIKTPIHVIENRVDVEAFAQARQERPERPLPIVGWIGATSWRSGDLEQLRGILGPFLARHGLRAYHGGHLDKEDVESFALQADVRASLVDTRDMAPIDVYPSLFTGLDLGLVPLRDVAFNRGKSWIKGLEYAAAGVPFVASNLPEYDRLQKLHGIGRVARRPRDWTAYLGLLLDDETRAAEAEENLTKVKALDIREGIGDRAALYLELLANGG